MMIDVVTRFNTIRQITLFWANCWLYLIFWMTLIECIRLRWKAKLVTNQVSKLSYTWTVVGKYKSCVVYRGEILVAHATLHTIYMWIHARVKSGRDYHATALPVVNTEGCGILVLVSYINIIWLERQWGAIGVVFYPFSLHFCFTCIQAKVTKPFPALCQVPGPWYCHSVFHILTTILKLLIF